MKKNYWNMLTASALAAVLSLSVVLPVGADDAIYENVNNSPAINGVTADVYASSLTLTGANSVYDLKGFSSGNTGGGIVAESNTTLYKKCIRPQIWLRL